MNLFEMFEARDLTNPNVQYSDKKKNKVVDRVIATLQGNDSGAFTRVAKRYKQIDRLQAALKEKRDELNKEVTAKVESLFNAEDEIYTRVVDTVSIVMTLSKKTEVTTEDFDIDGYLEEVEKLLVGFEEKLQLLRTKYTEVETVTKKSALRVKIKESTSIWDKITAWADKIYSRIVNSLKKDDDKIAQIKANLNRTSVTETENADTQGKFAIGMTRTGETVGLFVTGSESALNFVNRKNGVFHFVDLEEYATRYPRQVEQLRTDKEQYTINGDVLAREIKQALRNDDYDYATDHAEGALSSGLRF